MPKHYPNELLYWRTIEWAKENGFHNLDLVGANRRWAEAILRNDPPPEGTEFSETRFKAKFGGRTLFVPEACCKFGNPLVSIMVMAFGRRFLTSDVAKRFSGI